MKIKICGITDKEELTICARYADALGFVVEYPIDVPWNISREKARELVLSTPPLIGTVVITTGNMKRIKRIVETTKPTTVQLHGEETPEFVKEFVEYSRDRCFKVIKAVQIDVDLDLDVDTMRSLGRDLLNVVKEYEEAGVDALLLDAKNDTPAGGTGITLDWSKIAEVTRVIDIPVIIAGGLNSDNVRLAVEQIDPFGVDVISGVETNGRKDEDKLKDFTRAVRGIR